MWLEGTISNLLSLGKKLLPAVNQFSSQPSSSSSSTEESHQNQIETELKKLMKLLEWIKARLYDAEEREIRDRSVKLWLKELRGVAYDAEDVLDEYHYEVLRAQVEATNASSSKSLKSNLIQVPDGMLDKIQQITCKFAEIAQHRIALQLSEEEAPRRCNSDMQIAPTSHFVVESDIIGRELEKKKLIDLLSNNHDGKTISVVTIVGTGGIGKTTLAQLVYNDLKNRKLFDKFGWVCVSEDFNVQRLIREVSESITGKPCDLTNMSALQMKISEEIEGKKVFLVLDDVWNENRSLWESFRKSFMSFSLFKILVTTRNETVAHIMQTQPTFKLNYMSEEQSWRLFQHYAFGKVVSNRGSNLVEIGKLIMKKCGNLPLAIKSIASLLRHEPKEESWREILDNELWESDVQNEIFQPLQISYARLPTYLKSCFLYCSMFPKDFHIDAEELVRLWISQGYVQNNGLKNKKKVGWEYIKQLWQRSFFQGEYREKSFIFTLHDIIHDLTRSISGHGCYSIGEDMVPNLPEELYHLYVVDRSKELTETDLPSSEKLTTLRTLFVRNTTYTGFNCFAQSLEAFELNFSEAQSLRALELTGDVYLNHVSFVNFKHLRYMCVDGMLERIPECIWSSYNLQYLTLYDNCLRELPESIKNLVSLEELTISCCRQLLVLPASLCQLKALRKLFICDCPVVKLPKSIKNLVSLEELKISDCYNLMVLPASLCQLKALRELFISNCPVMELPESIKNLVSLEELTISWCSQLLVLPASLCQLKALRELFISNCPVMELPESIKNLVSLEELTIKDCYHLEVLPASLCQLKALRELFISNCPVMELPRDIGNLTKLQYLVLIETGVRSLPPSLNKIIKNIQKLEVCLECSTIRWLEHLVDLGGTLIISMNHVCNLEDIRRANIESMHNLHRLVLTFDDFFPLDQYKYKGVFINFYNYHVNRYLESDSDHDKSLLCSLEPHHNLKELEIHEYFSPTFPRWIENRTLLESIVLNSSTISFLPFGGLRKLKHLKIEYCYSLPIIQEDSLPLMLEEIEISGCRNLISVTGIQRLESLVKLDIKDCRNLLWLDHCWDSKTCTITVTGCPKLREWPPQQHISFEENMLCIKDYGGRTFPDWIGNPTSCASLELIGLKRCAFITFLPFGDLQKLKRLIIHECSSLQIIQEEFLPLVLEEIKIFNCLNLISVKGMQRLKSLVKLIIANCENLCWLDPCERANIISVSRCPKLRELCSQHGICYVVEDSFYSFFRWSRILYWPAVHRAEPSAMRSPPPRRPRRPRRLLREDADHVDHFDHFVKTIESIVFSSLAIGKSIDFPIRFTRVDSLDQ
ncbi:hypothetical protein LUZ61_003661 [Rhynchospora tenuis]|uniref:Uncharacterized protein n=1 Tax=Rhynchospora tenuis TaxID=198213 RepID=A0AAD6ESZ8_9POAL|nr:hypothetical protein LUZ61_003661 [Rhynchospora tenuis]